MKLKLEIETINFGFGSTALSFVFNTFIFGASFAHFWALWGFFWRQGQVQKHFWNLLMWKYSPIFCFKFGQILGLFSLFEPFGVIFLARWGSKTCLEPTNVDYQFFLEVQPYLFVLNLGPLLLFEPFRVIFLGGAPTSISRFFRSYVRAYVRTYISPKCSSHACPMFVPK